jgi:lipopolysaccharide export system protein LptA
MSARDTSLVASVRRGIAALLVVLLAAVVYHFALRRPRATGPVPEKTAPAALNIDRKEGIRHREYKDGKVWADVRADRFFLGGDGLNHLEGAVEVVDYGRDDGRIMRITADTVAYDKEMVYFTVSGRVKVNGGDLTFESDALDYDKNLGIYRTAKGGAFSADRLAGSGRTLEYSERANKIWLSGGFRLEVKPEPTGPETVTLTGDSLIYLRNDKAGRVEGHARVAWAEGEGDSGLVRFELTDDERFLRSVTFEKSARCIFTGGQDGPGQRMVEAATVRVLPFPDSSRVSCVEAVGDCRLTLDGRSEPAGSVQAREIRLVLDRGGKIDGWTAAGEARMSRQEKSGGTHEFTGENISYSSQGGFLAVREKEGEAARLESPESRIEAPVIELATGPNNVDVSGGVRLLLKPRPEGTAIGFFSRDASVFAASRALKSSGEEHKFHFEGDVRIWQGERSIQAGAMDILESTGEVGASGGVTAAFPRSGKNGAGEGRIEAGGDEMTFSPAESVVSFRGRSFVKIPDARLAADTVNVSLSGERKEVRDLRAQGRVVFVYGNYEGRGEEARYDPDADVLVLTGRPVLVEKGKGDSRGDKLTFRLGDDKILIENKGQGRSITVVKS